MSSRMMLLSLWRSALVTSSLTKSCATSRSSTLKESPSSRARSDRAELGAPCVARRRYCDTCTRTRFRICGLKDGVLGVLLPSIAGPYTRRRSPRWKLKRHESNQLPLCQPTCAIGADAPYTGKRSKGHQVCRGLRSLSDELQ